MAFNLRLVVHVIVGLAAGLAARPLQALDPTKGIDDYVFKNWVEEQGLPHHLVWTVFQTRDGYIWLGAQDGLVRFDGLRFTRFGSVSERAFAEDSIRSLAEAPDGSLWIAPMNADLLRLSGRRFERIANLLDDKWRLMGARALRVDRKGTLWLANSGGIAYVGRDGKLVSLAAPPSVRRVNRWDLTEDSQGAIWFGAPDGVYRVVNGQVVRVVRTGTVRGIHMDDAGTLWLGVDRRGLYRYRDGALTAVPLPPEMPLTSIEINVIRGDRDGNLWVGANNGLCRLSKDGRSAVAVPLLAGVSVQDLIEDQVGSLWLATRAGLFQIRDPAFRTYASGPNTQDVTSVIEDQDGAIWFVSVSAPHIQQVVRGEHRVFAGAVPAGAHCIYQDRSGRYWLGAEGLYRLEGRTFVRYPGSPSARVMALAEDSAGRLWLADASGVVYRVEGDGGLKRMADLTGRWIESLRALPDGSVWIATRSGGLRWKEGALREIPLGATNAEHFVRSISNGSDGVLWLGTRDGLVRIQGERKERFTIRDGLPDAIVNGVVDDGLGNLWIGTSKGICRVPKADLDSLQAGRIATLSSALFDRGDGIKAGQASGVSALHARDGSLWFATTLGVATIPRAKLAASQGPPPVFIEEVRVDERSYDPAREADVPPGDRRLVLRFTALDYNAPTKLRFRYRLDGVDSRWRDADVDRKATYTQLSPGSYTFRVVARNSYGVWNDAGAAMRLHFRPRFRERRLFPMLLLALAAAALALGYRWRLQAHRARQEELTRTVEERTLALQREVAERMQAEDAVRQLAAGLEQRVLERTVQLETATLSLEEDIASRQRAEQALSEEKERLAVTLRSIGDGVIATDVDGRIVLLNRVAEELTGWTQADATGRALGEVFRIVQRWSREPLPDPIQSVLQGGAVLELPSESLLLARDGRELLIADSAAPIRDPASRITGVVLVFRDVTEKRKAEEQLANADKLESIGILAAGIAHDFNNLLTGVFGYIDLARKRSAPDGEVHERLTKAIEVLDRGRGLAGQLLTFTSGGLPVTAPTDVGALLRNAARFALAGSTVTCELSIPDDLWLAEIDAGQIGQVVDNLLINARQAMPHGGCVTVAARNVLVDDDPIIAEGRYVQVSVEDQGLGIPAEHRSRVFDPFFTTKPGGSGLGLPTAHSIVKRHGGNLEFDSVMGEGTTFRFYLPVAAAKAPSETQPVDAPDALEGRILVMDDEEIVREVLHDALEGLGLQVELTADGVAAIAALRAALGAGHPFDLAILDLTIAGGMGGVETLGELRKLQPSLKAIASSGYSSDPVMANPEVFGFQSVLTKPYSMTELSRTIAPLLGKAD